MACKACRARKIKCDRTRPVCQNCRQRSSHCTYTGERRTRRWTEAGMPSTDSLSAVRRRQPAEIRSLMRADLPALPPSTRPQMQSPGASPSCWRSMDPHPMEMEPDAIAGDILSTRVLSYEPRPVLQTPTSSGASQQQYDNLLDKILDGDDMECLKDRNPALWMRASDGDEYTGPSSGISTVSDLGLNWVRDNVAESDVLCETIQDIRNGILSHIRQPKCIPQDLPLALLTPSSSASTRDISQELPPAQAMAYVEAYFSTVQVLFPVLDRDVFLAQLAAVRAGQAPASTYSWQALYNAVLASGCRATLSEETAEAFKTSGREAWSYFQKALSFESRILHGATDLMAIQAVAVMTIFAQGLSSPQRLEYTLSSIASRLAQSLALNRHPPPEWDLTESEKRERNRVFWVIYCLDKMIGLRCGRPCVIYDEEVSCCFPRGVRVIQRGDDAYPMAPGGWPPFDFFLCFTKLSHIGGNVSRMLYSATALYTPSSRLVLRLNGLLEDLQAWVHSIPDDIRPGKHLNRMPDTHGLSRDQIVVLHASYYYVLCAIYRRFTPIFTQDSKSLEHLIDSKSHVSHIEAARCIALLTKHLDFESFSPAWLVFYYPFTALTTIFVHIVSNPPSESTQSDIALMEAVVGFFGRLEYITSGETAFTKTAEFVRQARRVTDMQNKALARKRFPDPPASNHTATTASVLLQDYPGARNDTLETPEKVNRDAAAVHEQPKDPTSITVGGLGTLSPQEDAENSVGLRMGPASVYYDNGVSQQSQALYTDLVSLLAPPSNDDASHINWLGDWVSVGTVAKGI
ncbi:hypothetical protein CNMCM6106_002168 [Aspergillus hiratsukae]|uniref:Zn(2)-C6 fungal-type domain-containing protein n=1 Tax=Aspergillus hiratsukae TaxID=1194566 RepID=A0A8H6UXC7_9EURO|nr:hypothetical protein CNMCM6106_002168 [Aspergillus hiratsukae]